jgi:hypothetical protein
MDSQKFDWLARFSASGLDRRVVAKSLAAGALAEVGLTRLADRVEAKRTDPGVLFFELLAARMKRATGDCDALAQAADDFRKEHLAVFLKIANAEQQWDAGKRARVATRYQDRITRATEALHALMASCRFRGTSEAGICAANGSVRGEAVAPPGEAQCDGGCDCACICPISGWDCAASFFGCMGGSHASCCWFGACAGNMCAEQCPNCCNCGVDCCGC